MRVNEPEKLHQNKERNEENDDREHVPHQYREKERFPPREAEAGEGVGRGHGDEHAEHRRCKGDPDAVSQVAEKLLSRTIDRREERRVLLDRWLGRYPDRRLLNRRELRLERGRDHPDHW